MRIEALESIKSSGYVLDAGDIKQSIPDEIGSAWVASGWARDLDGVVQTGNRVVLDARLTIDPTIHVSIAPEA